MFKKASQYHLVVLMVDLLVDDQLKRSSIYNNEFEISTDSADLSIMIFNLRNLSLLLLPIGL